MQSCSHDAPYGEYFRIQERSLSEECFLVLFLFSLFVLGFMKGQGNVSNFLFSELFLLSFDLCLAHLEWVFFRRCSILTTCLIAWFGSTVTVAICFPQKIVSGFVQRPVEGNVGLGLSKMAG